MFHYVHGLHTLDIPQKNLSELSDIYGGNPILAICYWIIMDLQTKSIGAISIFQVPTDVPSPTQGTSVTLVTSQLVRWIPSSQLSHLGKRKNIFITALGGDMLNFRRVKHQHMVDFP